MKIHPTAIIAPDARLAEGVEVGAFSIIGHDVTIGKNTIIGPHTVIDDHTDIGESCSISQFCSIGAPPQDLKYRGEPTRVIIGNSNTIREFVTIHRATTADIGKTVIGNSNLVMAYSHIAHNCILGSFIVMANAATLAGHILVEDFAILGGMVGLHQFTRVGTHAMVGGMSAIPKDIPPYTMASGNRAKLFGLNMVGLRRRNFPKETVSRLKDAYHTIFRSNLQLKDALEKADAAHADCPEVQHFIKFIRESKRGICR
jgi:UDP-N-acetylglucosamine acyltransferase